MKKMLSVVIAVMMMISCVSSASAMEILNDGISIDVTINVEANGAQVGEGAVWAVANAEGLQAEFDAMGVKGQLVINESGLAICDLNNGQAIVVSAETIMKVLEQVMGMVDTSSLNALASLDFTAIAGLVEKYAAMLSGVVNPENMTIEEAEYTLPVIGETVNAMVVTITTTAEDWTEVLTAIANSVSEDEELKAVISSVLKMAVTAQMGDTEVEINDEQMAAMVDMLMGQMMESVNEESIAQIAEQLAAVSVKIVGDDNNFYEASVDVMGQTIGLVAKAEGLGGVAAVYMAAGEQVMPLAVAEAGMTETGLAATVAVPMAGVQVDCAVEMGETIVATVAVTMGEDTLTATANVSLAAREFSTFEGETVELTYEELMAVVEQAMASAMN